MSNAGTLQGAFDIVLSRGMLGRSKPSLAPLSNRGDDGMYTYLNPFRVPITWFTYIPMEITYD